MLATRSGRQWMEQTSNRERWNDLRPLGFADGPNKYRYAGNDPINFRDPTGEFAAANPLRTVGRSITRAVGTVVRAYNPLLSTIVNAGAGVATSLVNSRPAGLRAPQQFTYAPPRAQVVPPSSPTAVSNFSFATAPANTDNSFVLFSGLSDSIDEIPISAPSRLFPNQKSEISDSTPLESPEERVAATVQASTRQQVLDETIAIQNQVVISPRRFDGSAVPEVGGTTFAEANTSRMRHLLTQSILSQSELREFEKLYVLNLSSIDRFHVVVGALSGFGKGFVPPGGTLNVQGPKTSNGIDFTTPISTAHKNSLNFEGPTHVYAIRGPKGIVKIGESARGLRNDGRSIRGELQARKLTQSTGEKHESVVLKIFPGKAPARQYETQIIERFRSLHGQNTLPGNQTNR